MTLHGISIAAFVCIAGATIPSEVSAFNLPEVAKARSYNYRDSGSGRYMKKGAAQRRPANTVEKERRRTR
jgi:hypothetical protein